MQHQPAHTISRNMTTSMLARSSAKTGILEKVARITMTRPIGRCGGGNNASDMKKAASSARPIQFDQVVGRKVARRKSGEYARTRWSGSHGAETKTSTPCFQQSITAGICCASING